MSGYICVGMGSRIIGIELVIYTSCWNSDDRENDAHCLLGVLCEYVVSLMKSKAWFMYSKVMK